MDRTRGNGQTLVKISCPQALSSIGTAAQGTVGVTIPEGVQKAGKCGT